MMRRVPLAILLAVAACARAAAGPAPPPPIPAPELGHGGTMSIALLPEAARVVLLEPAPAHHDEILSSRVARDPEFQREVRRWVEFWRAGDGRSFAEYLNRMGWFGGTVDSTLSRKGMPLSLRYVPIVESGYSPSAVSRARAVGMWQFVEHTARGFGMGVEPLLDERRNPFKSTEAATDFLLELRERFDSWFFALAAYNSGPYRIQRLLEQRAPLLPRTDSLFWALRRHLPRETQDYIPKLFAAALVAENPATYGVISSDSNSRFAFDEVIVPDATTLDVVAEAADAALEEIERLNPEVVRGITPPGRETILRVPVGRGWAFRERYALIPPDERVTFVEHRVVAGETLSHIALRYGVALSDLQAANPRVRPRTLQIGQRLTVPIAPKGRSTRGSAGG